MTWPLLHHERAGKCRPVYTLSTQSLTQEPRETRRDGAGTTIPLAAIVGFYAVVPPLEGAFDAQQGSLEPFLVVWREGDQTRRERWMVNAHAPSFRRLIEGLVELRPDASLLDLPSEEAHRRLGMRSTASLAMGVVAVGSMLILLFVVVTVGVVLVTVK